MNTEQKKAAPKRLKQGWKRPLNVRQQRFCELVASGMSGTEAWLKAGYQVSRQVARANAAECLAKPNIRAYLAELRKPQTKAAMFAKEEKLAFLALLVRTAIGDVGPKSPLCAEYHEERIGGGRRGKLRRGKAPAGNEIDEPEIYRVRTRMYDKLKAIELHSKMVGDFEPERVKIEDSSELADLKARAANLVSALDRSAEALVGKEKIIL